MPRPVVPILPSPAAASRIWSSSRCSGRISAAVSAMRRLSRPIDRPCPLSLVDLVGERPRIDDDAVADERQLARPHDAGRKQRQLVGDAVDHQRVAGIVPALEPHHDVGAFRKPVDDLALALVAPLGADHRDIGHSRFSCMPTAPMAGARGRLRVSRTGTVAAKGKIHGLMWSCTFVNNLRRASKCIAQARRPEASTRIESGRRHDVSKCTVSCRQTASGRFCGVSPTCRNRRCKPPLYG